QNPNPNIAIAIVGRRQLATTLLSSGCLLHGVVVNTIISSHFPNLSRSPLLPDREAVTDPLPSTPPPLLQLLPAMTTKPLIFPIFCIIIIIGSWSLTNNEVEKRVCITGWIFPPKVSSHRRSITLKTLCFRSIPRDVMLGRKTMKTSLRKLKGERFKYEDFRYKGSNGPPTESLDLVRHRVSIWEMNKERPPEPLDFFIWTVEDVGLWLEEINLGSYRQIFKENGVNGEYLEGMSMFTTEQILRFIRRCHMKWGDFITLCKELRRIKVACLKGSKKSAGLGGLHCCLSGVFVNTAKRNRQARVVSLKLEP
ncbi:hypothetical protein HYC85_011790, partial [Camellia sinensis]